MLYLPVHYCLKKVVAPFHFVKFNVMKQILHGPYEREMAGKGIEGYI